MSTRLLWSSIVQTTNHRIWPSHFKFPLKSVEASLNRKRCCLIIPELGLLSLSWVIWLCELISGNQHKVCVCVLIWWKTFTKSVFSRFLCSKHRGAEHRFTFWPNRVCLTDCPANAAFHCWSIAQQSGIGLLDAESVLLVCFTTGIFMTF